MKFKEVCVETLRDCKYYMSSVFDPKFWLYILFGLCFVCAGVSGLAVFTWTIVMMFFEGVERLGLMTVTAAGILLVTGFLTSVLGRMVRGV